MVNVYNGILLSQTIYEQNFVIYRDMDLPTDYHTEWTKSEREKYHILMHIYMESRKIVWIIWYANQK